MELRYNIARGDSNDKGTDMIPEIIGDPESVESGEYEEKPACVFVKHIAGSKVSVFAVDSGASLELFVQTMYAGKKRGSIADMADAKAPTRTPETTAGTAPNGTVTQTGGNVKQHQLRYTNSM